MEQIRFYEGELSDAALEIQNLTVVQWPESQDLMMYENWTTYCELINTLDGIAQYGSSAYVVDKLWLEEVTKEKEIG